MNALSGGLFIMSSSAPVSHLVHLRDPAGVVQHSLGQGGLPGVDVRGDADVPDPLVRGESIGARATAADQHLRHTHSSDTQNTVA